MDENEVKAAIKLLDKNNDGFIEFVEFVQWWQNKVRLQDAISSSDRIPCAAWSSPVVLVLVLRHTVMHSFWGLPCPA